MTFAIGNDAGTPTEQVGNHPLPVLVMVSGAPGSGKSTLARLLAEELDIPWLNRDRLSRGIRFTDGVLPHPGESWRLWYENLAFLLSQSVSLVMDQTMYRGVAERDIKVHLLGRCRARLIHCYAPNALDRLKERERFRHGESSEEYQRVLGLALEAQSLTTEPLDLGVEVLTVETVDHYRPSLQEMITFIRRA
jgi:predicted kinase